MNPVTAYAKAVTSGEIIACKWVRLACERHLRDLDDDRFFFDEAEAQRWIDFFPQNLRHYKGECAGQPFHLEPWEEFIIGCIFGWKLADTGKRRFRYAYIEVPRKNGKTTLVAGIGVGGLLDEPGAEVYTVATKEDQAKLAWRDGVTFIKNSPHLSKALRTRIKAIHFDPGHAIWRPLGSDSETQDGLNPSIAIMDELHAWKSRDLFDVIDDAMGARAQPLIPIITTAGYNKNGICYEQRQHVESILETTIDDESYFGIIFTVDDPDNWDCETEWQKANPNLGISKTWEFMRDQAARAKQMPSKLNAFLNKQLNIWTEAEVSWLPMDQWDACAGDAEMSGPCFAGLDLASVSDIAAFVRYWPETGLVFPTFWIPEEGARKREKESRVPYPEWIRQGLIRATEGNVTDYDVIRRDILEIAEEYPIQEIPFDRWNSSQLVTQLQGDGLEMVSFGQGFASMSAPSKELEKLVAGGKLRHRGNPVLRWMAGNVVATNDPSDNIKPDKKKSREKIDGIVALIMAIGRAQVHVEEPKTKPFIQVL